MIVYLALTIWLLIQVLFCFGEREKANSYFVYKTVRIKCSNILIIIDIAILLFLAVFRDISIGTDYKTYYLIISSLQNVKFNDFVNIANDYYIEAGFVFFSKLLLIIFNNPLFVFFVWYFIIIAGIVFFARQYDENPFFSLYLFVTFSLFNQSLNTMRQFIAASIILFSLCCLKKNMYIKCGILMIIAISIHYSAIFGVLFLIVSKIKKDVSSLCLVTVIMSFFISLMGMPFVQYVVNVAGYGRYLSKELSSESGVGIIMNLLFFGLFFFFRKQFRNNLNYNLWIFACAITLSLNFFIDDLGMISRMMIYSKIFYLASLQDFICSFDNIQNRRVIKYLMLILFFVYYCVSVSGTCFQTSPYKLLSF